MTPLIHKELKHFLSNIFSILSVAILVVLAFLFLWIFPDSSYVNFGLAEGDLYFQFLSYLLLFIVPIFSVGLLSDEYRHGTAELLRSLDISWYKAVIAKFCAALIILIVIMALTSVHLYCVYELSLNDEAINLRQIIGSYMGLLGIGACYIGISLMVTSFVEQTAASLLITIFMCFILYSGLDFLSSIPAFEGGIDYWLDRLSLSYHSDQIGRGILRLSTMGYFSLLVAWTLWTSSYRLSTKEV